jgi:cytochrome c oxidase subunit III
MGDLVRYPSPHAKAHTTAYIGMVIFIGAWAMMFACFFFAYGALRVGAKEWPPTGQPMLPLGMPALNTLVLVLSSAALEAGIFGVRRGRVAVLGPMVLLSALFGALFLVLQYAVGAKLYADGLTPDTGPYASVFYGLAGVHALHVAVGVLALVWLSMRAFQKRYNAPQHLPVRLWSVYWHFVGVVWLLMFVFVFAI